MGTGLGLRTRMSEPRGLAGAVLSIRSPRPLSATQRPGTLPWEAARAPTPCGRASRRIWGPPHPCTLSQVRDSRAQPLTTPSGQGPGDHQGDQLPSGPELPGGATRRPLQLMSWCPGCQGQRIRHALASALGGAVCHCLMLGTGGALLPVEVLEATSALAESPCPVPAPGCGAHGIFHVCVLLNLAHPPGSVWF